MNHRYIDESSVAERYLRHTLAPGERVEFERHLTGCEECADRLLLAQIFLRKDLGKDLDSEPYKETHSPRSSEPVKASENGSGRHANASEDWHWPAEADALIREPLAYDSPSLPWPARFVAQFTPWQFALILAIAAALLLFAPTAYYLVELARLRAHP